MSTPESGETTFGAVAADSSLKGLASAVPAVVDTELSASVAKLNVLMSAAKIRPPSVIAMPSNNRQTPFIWIHVVFIFSPP